MNLLEVSVSLYGSERALPLSDNASGCECAVLSRVRLFVTPWTAATRLLCPWDSPGKNTGVGCCASLWGIFPTPGLNPRLFHLLHWQVGSLPLSYLGSPWWCQWIVTLETSMGLRILCSKLDRWLWHLHGQYCSLLLFKNNYEDFFP